MLINPLSGSTIGIQGGGKQLPPRQIAKLKSWANFQHKLGKNSSNT